MCINNADNKVVQFQEKPAGDSSWINGGYFVLDRSVINLIEGDHSSFEYDVLPRLSAECQLSAFKHRGFWQPMDTLRDKHRLEEMWNDNMAPWKLWA